MMTDLTETIGHEAEFRHNLKEGLAMVGAGGIDLVILDVNLPDGSGLEMLSSIKCQDNCPEVIIITGMGDAAGAALAIKCGAWDYLTKTSGLERTNLALRRALEHRQKKLQRHGLRALNREKIIGASSAIQTCLDQVAQAAETDFNVLITGETGTGKELFARAIHDNSRRADHEMVVVDCASLPETVVESILFGHERGSFTGAQTSHQGLIKMADGGTLFLDELGELPLTIQRSFLRVLQEKRFRPVGGCREETSDFRLIAATNQDLDHLVNQGHFRRDLLFRVRCLTIHLPPLRDRSEDIETIAMHILMRLGRNKMLGSKGASSDFFGALASYHWPGNVRELANVLEVAFTTASDEPTLLIQHLPDYIRIGWTQKSLGEPTCSNTPDDRLPDSNQTELPDIRQYRQHMDYRYLKELMARSQGDRQKASLMSGLSVSRLYALLKTHGFNDD
ncbi:MAG: sigma-54-dependent Fis family transcriptional regulator [Deltaproteobacteria bacterium]|nr:sigma-54-dependent Fis family transcriptional regulator [Deltaproteobacteria bacterium]